MNAPQHPKANAEVVRPDRPFVSEIPKLRKIISSEGLAGLANDTKWNELIAAMRSTQEHGWRPDFRFRCVDSEWISGWDGEWCHHLPFPFISVRWLDLRFIEKTHRGRLLSPEIIDHSEAVEKLLTEIGLDYEKGEEVVRIFGYAPRDRTNFTPKRG
jgi:hypothetical protein